MEKGTPEYEAYRLKRLESTRAYRKRYPERVKQSWKKSWEQNREEINRRNRERRKLNSETKKQSDLDYYYERMTSEDFREKRWKGHLKSAYGISIEDYALRFDSQNGVCAICSEPETAVRGGRTKRLAVDHCHTTGRIRGLLCAKCNSLIGHAKDSLVRLHSAIKYLETR